MGQSKAQSPQRLLALLSWKGGIEMTDKQKAIALLKLLSALESWGFSTKERIPDYLHEELAVMVEWLESEILKP